jgi:hypothetical protein
MKNKNSDGAVPGDGKDRTHGKNRKPEPHTPHFVPTEPATGRTPDRKPG